MQRIQRPSIKQKKMTERSHTDITTFSLSCNYLNDFSTRKSSLFLVKNKKVGFLYSLNCTKKPNLDVL